ncbi:MAG: sigma-54 dependent transcriptional regulator [Myxococcota bacterium]
MDLIRSILWIGPAESFEADLASEVPSLDIVWERDAEGALDVSLAGLDAVVIDAVDPDEAAVTVGALQRRPGLPPLLVRIGAGDAASASELRAAGATTVLLRRPGPPEQAMAELVESLDKIAEPSRPAPRTRLAGIAPGIVGESPEMQEVFALVDCASRSRATVVITGETGTGKELVARAIHDRSPQRRRSFVALNCAAFPDTLLESELFGHTRGAFTSADRDRKGLFEAAEGGTLFLDEVSETSGPFQAKLLRVLQEREVRPLGSNRSRRMDVRVLAASNRNLRHEVAEGRFRDDLYYRLAVFPIHVPPLRSRPTDVLPLAEHFLRLHRQREGKAGVRLAPDAGHLLQAYQWPGNVRELENEIQRALALAEPGETLTPRHFSERLAGVLEPIEANLFPGETIRETLGRIEAWLLRRALDAHGGNRTETARRLGITREGLYKKMKRLNVE